MRQQRVPVEAVEQAILQLRSLARTLIEYESTFRSALGFKKTMQYHGIDFHVSDRFIVADLRPLAFLGLLEEIDQDMDAAIERLYDRIAPLLTCRHEWTSAERQDHYGLTDMIDSVAVTSSHPHVCKLCTAYAQMANLPQIGRGFEKRELI